MKKLPAGSAEGIIAKINNLIETLSGDRKADVAWKEEAERRFATLEEEVAYLGRVTTA